MNFKFELYMRVSCTFRISRYSRNLAGSVVLYILYSLRVIVRILETYFSLTSSWMNKCPYRVPVVMACVNIFIYQLKIHIFISEFSKLIFKIVFNFWNISEIHCIFFLNAFNCSKSDSVITACTYRIWTILLSSYVYI